MEESDSAVSRTARAPLRWRQPSFWTRHYELTDDNRPYARLEWQSFLSSKARATFRDTTWEFQRRGIFRRRVTIHLLATGQSVGEMAMRWSGAGTLQMADGSQYEWCRYNFWSTRFGFESAGRPIAEFHRRFGLRTNVDVAVRAAGTDAPHLSLLLTLGMYLMMLIEQDSSSS
jgi:hypothetical protein